MTPKTGAAPRTIQKPAVASGDSTPTFKVEVETTTDGLAARRAAWDALARNVVEPNPFYESWMMLPALEHLQAGERLHCAFVYRDDVLIGFFPLTESSRYKKLPIRVLALWKHLHCYVCAPLIHREHGKEALHAFLNWAATQASLVELSYVPAEGPLQHLFIDVLNERGQLTFIDESFNRAMLFHGPDGESYLEAAISTSHRRDLRRRRKRLEEQGSVEIKALKPDEDVGPWIDDFLRLETAGWKGREQSSMAADARQQAFFTAISRGAFERGRLRMDGLFLNGKPIGLMCIFESKPGSFGFKMAYDESLSKFSPGVMLTAEVIVDVLGQNDIDWVDTCAVPGHTTIGRLWKDRRIIQTTVVSTGRRLGDFVVGLLPLLRGLRRIVRKSSPKSTVGLDQSKTT